MFCAARSMPTSLQSVGDKPMKDGFAWGSRGLVIICGANFGRVEQWWVSMSDFFFQFLSRLNISEKCQTSMVYEQRTPPKKTTWPTIYGCKMVQTNDLNSKFMSIPLKTLWHITCLPKHWLPIWGMGFCKKTKLFIDTQRRLIVLKDPQPKAKQLQSIRGPLGLESGPRVPQKTVDLSSHTSCLGASIPRQKAVVCWSPE